MEVPPSFITEGSTTAKMGSEETILGEIQVQPYHWEYEDVDGDVLQIRVWALDRNSQPHLLRIETFPSFCYIELPTYAQGRYIQWNDGEAELLYQRLKLRLSDHQMLPFHPNHFSFQKKLYYYQGGRTFPFLSVGFRAQRSLSALKKMLSYPFDIGDGIRTKLNVWEVEINPIRKLLTRCRITHSGWLHCEGRAATDLEVISNLQNEWFVNWTTIKPIPQELCSGWYTSPGILVFDIESYSDRHKAFPDKWNPLHHAYMISCIYQRVGSAERLRYGIVMGDCCDEQSKLPPNTVLFKVESVEQMSRMFASIIQHHQPEIITGYNINDFDWDYLDARHHLHNEEWPIFGRLLNRRPKIYRDNWKSDGYGQNNISMLQVPGIINIDTLSVVKRDYKMSSYKLDVVAQFFVGKSKHAITPQQMFEIYERNMKASQLRQTLDLLQQQQREEAVLEIGAAEREMMEVMCYCIQDSELVLDILDKLHFWIASGQMAAVAGVTIEELYTRGQQQRCLSQLYDLAACNGIVLDMQPTPENIEFQGGHVCEPDKGIHDNVITLDFTSLYPSIIIGFNICYTTLVPRWLESKVKDEECNVIDICQDGKENEVEGQQSKVLRSYRYVKEPQGILPRLVHRLIDERNKVKLQIKNTTDPLQLIVLDKRQLALKVMANSFFGFVGVRVGGKRSLLEAAECITAKGRWLIGEVNTYLREKYQAKVVYGDTDSSMVVLPQVTSSEQCHQWGHKLAKEVSTLFPPPVKMEFEKACRMLLLDKKLYVGLFISRDGNFTKKGEEYELLTKGVLLARRDNCKWARDIFKKLVTMILLRESLVATVMCLISEVKRLLNGEVPVEDLTIVKTLGSNYANENYQMKVFSDNLRRLGRPAQPGDRLFYIIVEGDAQSLLGNRMMTPEIYMESQSSSNPYKIDYIYYLEHMLRNPVDKMVSIAYREDVERWNFLSYRPTNRHKAINVGNPVHMISSVVSHGGSLQELEDILSHSHLYYLDICGARITEQ